jgi:aspartyl-tRNA(Asn)/glutamyl-tRNA(Gln) amidotransferase subunit A
VLYGAAQAGAHGTRTPEEKAQMDPDLVRYAEGHLDLRATDYLAAVMARQALVDGLRRFFDEYDLLFTPTVAVAPFELGRVNPAEVAGRPVRHLDWTLCYPFNFSGQPAISIPAGESSTGVPIGAQLVGRRHEDELLLEAGAAIEAAAPWSGRWPAEFGPARQADGMEATRPCAGPAGW